MEITFQSITEIFKRKGYIFYTRPNELNIVGIRKLDKANFFDDKICLLFSSGTQNIVKIYPATTEPGSPYLLNPINIKGTAILAEGQYVDTYSIDLHRGSYEAICQRLKEVPVWRDADLDDNFDLSGKLDIGFHGINIHRASLLNILEFVGRNSAGCQVIQDSKHFKELMELAYTHADLYGNKFTYTLINEEDFNWWSRPECRFNYCPTPDECRAISGCVLVGNQSYVKPPRESKPLNFFEWILKIFKSFRKES